jgi:hypothetical protein
MIVFKGTQQEVERFVVELNWKAKKESYTFEAFDGVLEYYGAEFCPVTTEIDWIVNEL